MKKTWKAIMSFALIAAMAFGLAACGGSGDSGSADSGEQGKVLNIWCWNDEFQSRFNDYYPGVKEVAEDKSTTTLEDGTVVEQIPSETEAAISPAYDTSFVTLCFGTSNNNAELVGKSIKLALARYTNYVTNENTGIDLVYRSEIGDTAETVASKTGVDVADITTDGVLLDDTTVINSGVKKLDSFDRRSPVNLGGIESSNWYHK